MKRKTVMVLITALICLLAAVSCQHQNEKSDRLVYVTVNMRLDSRYNNTTGPNRALSTNVVTAMICAIPESMYPISPETNLSEGFDQGLLDLAQNSVTLTVPLDTSMRLVKITYDDEYTLAQLLTGGAPPTYVGISDAFTIVAGTTSKTVEVLMEVATSDGSGGIIGGTVQGTDLSSLSGESIYFAGDGTATSATPGTGTGAGMPSPYGMTTDGANFFVTDLNRAVIYAVEISSGEVFIIAGQDGVYGSDDNSNATAATFRAPTGITYAIVDGTGYLFVTDYVAHLIRRITLTGSFAVETIAGADQVDGSTNDANGTNARFNAPYGIVVDPGGGNIFVADKDNHLIRQISLTPPYAVNTFAGAGTQGSTDDFATAAEFNFPADITIGESPDGDKFLFVADMQNNAIRMIDESTQEVTTMTSALNYPKGITTDGYNLFVADSLAYQVQIVPIYTGTPTVLSGSGAYGCSEGPAGTAQFAGLKGLVSDGTNIYGVDNGCGRVFKLE